MDCSQIWQNFHKNNWDFFCHFLWMKTALVSGFFADFCSGDKKKTLYKLDKGFCVGCTSQFLSLLVIKLVHFWAYIDILKLESRWKPFHCIHLLLCMYWATHLSNWVCNTEECAIRIHCLCTSKQLNEGLFGWKQQVGSAQLRLMVVVGDGWVVLYNLHKKLGYRLCDFMSKDEVHKPDIETPYHTQMCLMCKV